MFLSFAQKRKRNTKSLFVLIFAVPMIIVAKKPQSLKKAAHLVKKLGQNVHLREQRITLLAFRAGARERGKCSEILG